MKLSVEGLSNCSLWQSKGYILPTYDRKKMQELTNAAPTWIHFGAGNIFRAFQANLAQRLLDEKLYDRGIVVAEGFDYEIIEKMYRPHDDFSVLVTLKADGNVEKRVIGSIAESVILDSENAKEFGRLKTIFSNPSLQMVTFTITEKGYSLVNGKGEILPQVEADFAAGPEKPQSYIGKVAALLYTRYLSGKLPLAMVSTDNCSHNGDKLFACVDAFAKKWVENGVADQGFVSYIEDKNFVSFPWSMIDKITPRPDANVEKLLNDDALEDLEPVITSKNTYVAPFVNAEESEYLVIEDAFPNGRPPLEKVGVIFTARETVDKVERMKVCTCLNPLHTSLAVYGCLLGYTKISDEMKDADLNALVKTIGYKEGLPVVVNPGVINPGEFIDTVINVRIPNPFMPDTPQRIAVDTSQKLSIRFGETIKNYIAGGLNLDNLKLIPLVHAGWLRYLMGIDDKGNAFELSPDPMLETVCPYVASVKLGEHTPDELAEIDARVLPLLKNKQIFGVDLEEVGLSKLVLTYFHELISGTGKVRETLNRAVR